MNEDIKKAFTKIKPASDLVMVCPSAQSIGAFTEKVGKIKKEVVQELHQYLLFPFITHIKSTEIEQKYELQTKMADAMRQILEKVTVGSFDMCMKIESGLLNLVFDNSQPGMVAAVPEELKLSVMKCLTVLNLNLDSAVRQKLLRTQIPLIAQAVFVSVHIAKLEKLRVLRLAAIDCLTAHTATHKKITEENYQITDKDLEAQVVDTLSSILPGVLAALQDVATDTENPGHVVVVAAIDAIHRILCITLHDKHYPRKQEITMQAFADVLREKVQRRDVSSKSTKNVVKRSEEWYIMAGEKLEVVTKSLVSLTTHDHYKVRKELARMFVRILNECSLSMQPSVPLALDVLISLTKDDYTEVSQYCTEAVNAYFANATEFTKYRAMDCLSDNFFATLKTLPRILNNIDSSRKLSALNLLEGYIQIMCSGRPQRLTTALSCQSNMQCVCNALLEAAALAPFTSMAQYATRDVTSPPPPNSPWCKLRHLDSPACEGRLRAICQTLAQAECAELIVDRLLEMFQQQRDCEPVCLMNWMACAPNCSLSLVRRILNTYIEEDVWYQPLEVGSREPPISSDETIDVNVYNPRAWTKDSVPDLYEGAVETRYTDISYRAPRAPPPREPDTCATLAAAQSNMLLSCLLTEGVGIVATRMKDEYQPFLLKTLCLVLERVGSKYEMLHLAGVKAMNAIAAACGHGSVAELIQCNADYFTNQVTSRLKKAWNIQSALQILSVVMEYSDSSILDCLYGIVEDVLVQSCDKYHQRDLQAYLQVFLTFIDCIQKWFPQETTDSPKKEITSKDIIEKMFKDLNEYRNSQEEAERLLNNEEMEKESGKSVEEMYREDMKKREEELLDYDDRVTEEKPPLPQHIRVTITIIQRCINFVPSPQRDEALLALQIITHGLPILRRYEDELLPLVHQTWAPLVGRMVGDDVVVLKKGLDLLVTMAELAKDFIRNRAVKEILPHIYKFLQKSSSDSYLKDAGSAYRNSQAYSLQMASLSALPALVTDLMLNDDQLEEAITCVQVYLTKKQPKPLQELAVNFFKRIRTYDYRAVWHHLRILCNNTDILEPPPMKFMKLEPIVGTPYNPIDKDYESNIKLIFNIQ